MSFEITIPRLGWSMEEGTFVRWLKRDGEWVDHLEQMSGPNVSLALIWSSMPPAR